MNANTSLPYRDSTAETDAAVARLTSAQTEGFGTDYPWLAELYARRIGRIAAGAVGCAGALITAVVMWRVGHGQAVVLLAACAAALLAWPVAEAWGQHSARRIIAWPRTWSSDPGDRLIQLTRAPMVNWAFERVRALELASVRLPLIAVALLLPLTLQLLFAVVMDMRGPHADEWLTLCGLLTIHVHTYAVWAAWRAPRARSHWHVIGIATLLSIFPGILSAGLATLFVAITSTLGVLVAFRPLTRRLAAERVALARLDG